MIRNLLPIHNPLPPAPLRRARLVLLAPLRLPMNLLRTVHIATLMVPTKRAPASAVPFPRLPALGPRTLVVRAITPRLVCESVPTVPRPPLTRVVGAKLAPLPLLSARSRVTPVLAAEARHAPVVAHVAVPHAVRPRAPLVHVAEAFWVSCRDVTFVDD
jgi:hypothetical protein